jgi:hypothetical protein
MTKSEIRLRIVETYPDLPLGNLNIIYDWIMFPEMEAERLEAERIEQEKKEELEPSPEEINKERIEKFIQRQKEKNLIKPKP